MQILGIGTVAVTLLVGAIAAIIAHRVTLPIRIAATAVIKLGKGDLDTRIAIKSKDEFATLGCNINHSATNIRETSKKFKRLGESSQQISRVVSLIHQIAQQTNLLAINTGIKAVCAEAGQGFSVIAEEVASLAGQSTTATVEIEGIVTNIQFETAEVIKAMELGTAQVVQGT